MMFNNAVVTQKLQESQHRQRFNSPESYTPNTFPRRETEKEKENINGVINKRINTYVAWCLAQPADWWVASAWASPSALQQKKDAAGHKVRLLSYGEEIRGRFEGAAASSWNFYSNECVAPRWDAEGKGAARKILPSLDDIAPISSGFPRRSRDSREISSRDARCFYKNHGDQSRSFALTRCKLFPAVLFSLRVSRIFCSFRDK